MFQELAGRCIARLFIIEKDRISPGFRPVHGYDRQSRRLAALNSREMPVPAGEGMGCQQNPIDVFGGKLCQRLEGLVLVVVRVAYEDHAPILPGDLVHPLDQSVIERIGHAREDYTDGMTVLLAGDTG